MKTKFAQQRHRVAKWIQGLALLVLVLVAGTLAAGVVARSNLIRRFPAPGQLVDVEGREMHIYCTGEGSPTVIMAAGLDDFSAMWSLVQPEVAKSTRVCSYDRPGLGWSKSSPNPRTSKNMVQELHTLLNNAEVEGPYVLVGHSFGGALMRLYANNYPNGVVGMVLVDAAPDDLFTRIPMWRNAIDGKIGFYRKLAPLDSLGLLAFTPGSIPNRGLPDNTLDQFRAVVVTSGYFQTGIAENELFENNLAEIRAAKVNLGDIPLYVISRGTWDPMPGFTDSENQQAQQLWQEMQSDLLSLSSQSRQVVATESEHNIQLQQPELVIEATNDVLKVAKGE